MTPTDRTPPLWIVGLLVAVSGFCSLVYQVVWERTVRGTFGGDSISSAIVTGTFLLGLGIDRAAAECPDRPHREMSRSRPLRPLGG